MRCYRLSSSTLGHRVTVHVHNFPTQAKMVAASEAFAGETFSNATMGATQAWVDEEGLATHVLVNLNEEHLTHGVISHELLHAAHALYGATLEADATVREHLHHHNEPLAHLHTDLYTRLLWLLTSDKHRNGERR